MNLLQLARQQIAAKSQWYNGETVIIWQNANRKAWLKNENGWLKMTLFEDTARLKDWKRSQPFPVGYYDPHSGLWVENASVFEMYPAWAQQTRRIMGVRNV